MLRYKMSKWLARSMLGVLLLAPGTVASAVKIPGIPGDFSANVALASEYYFRGLSQTDDAPAIQGGFDYEVEVASPTALYLGVWSSNVDFNEGAGVDGATIEIDLYGGLKGKVGRTGFSWDAGFIYYTYPGADSGLNYDFSEIYGAVGMDFGIASITGSVNYSPENFAKSGEAVYTRVLVNVPIPGVEGFAVSGYMAEQYIENDAAFGTSDYFEWNITATYNLAGLLDITLTYSDTDISPDIEGKDEAFIFSVGRTF